MSEREVSSAAVTAGDGPEPEQHDWVEEHGPGVVREGVSMALYVAISLLAVLIGLPAGTLTEPAREIFLTALGLLLAHAVAFQLSARLARRGRLIGEHARVLVAQFVGGLVVTALAVAPVLVSPDTFGVAIAELLLLGFVAISGYATARMIPVSRLRALLYVCAVVAVTLGVLGVKLLVDH